MLHPDQKRVNRCRAWGREKDEWVGVTEVETKVEARVSLWGPWIAHIRSTPIAETVLQWAEPPERETGHR